MALTNLLIDSDTERARAPGTDFGGVEQAKAMLGRDISTMEVMALLAGMGGSGTRLKAGTNSGSCIPELKKLLQSAPAISAAE